MTSPGAVRTAPQAPARVVIENVRPQIDGGRFAIKRCVGETVVVTADVHADGHDVIRAALRYRAEPETEWREMAMEPLGNDLWSAAFAVEKVGGYRYTVQAWVDRFRTWLHGLEKKVAAGQDVSVDILTGAELVLAESERASAAAALQLQALAQQLRESSGGGGHAGLELIRATGLPELMDKHGERRLAALYERELAVAADRPKACFSAWYEMFPRSCSPTPGKHGTFSDCANRLPYAAEMGFDVLYLPPIHPIGITNRKGRNGAPASEPGDVGSPWAIGAEAGGHTGIHPELGTLADFRKLVTRAADHGMEIALDLAYQCSPDHPWVQEHPEWFRRRPDGTIQYAENPPKKYEDIYPLNFENEQWRELWEALRDVALFWADQGVRIFRVDNPHTKPYAFWEWMIAEVRAAYPDVLFLAEAFTRPKVMYQLAKLGFTQSYTYFTWRNSKQELTEYLTELTRTEVREYFRPNFWPNTPDILHEYLQTGGRPAFQTRLVLAATLSSNYGIYGPAFELLENQPRSPGSEEYLNSEKYELKHWAIDRPDSLKDFIGRINQIRRAEPALQGNGRLEFQPVDNEQIIAYTWAYTRAYTGAHTRAYTGAATHADTREHTRTDTPPHTGAMESPASADSSSTILVVVNLDHRYIQSGWLDLPLERLGLRPEETFQVHDLLTDARYKWRGARNYVQLDPQVMPAHVFRILRG